MPDDVTNGYEVYSAEPEFLPDPSLESAGNLVNEETSTTVFAPAGPAPDYGYKALPYHTMKANIFEEPDGYIVDPVDVVTSLATFSAVSTMQVSGVDYYLPRNTGTGNPAATLQVDAAVNNFWKSSYRTDDRPLAGALGDTPPALLSSGNPAFIGLAAFSYEDGTFTVSTGGAGSFYTPSAYFLRKQRLEIPYTHLDGAGAYTEADGPLATDQMQIAGASYPTISFSGDDTDPAFTSDARSRVYLRLPRGNVAKAVDDGIQPTNPASVIGMGIYLTTGPGDNILFHSTSFEPVNLVGEYGNFITGAPTSPAYAGLATTDKDVHERFIDEVYRYQSTFLGIDAVYGPGSVQALSGPGLGTWSPSPIETPTRIGTLTTTTVWAPRSFIQTGDYAVSLGAGYLQVAGLPDRNPSYRYGQTVPFPSAGVCMYPHKDYSTGYDPVGPDYSALVGERSYIRCFDASFNGSVEAHGQPFFTIRIDGLQLQDYEYTAPGPGNLNSAEGIAIFVKVPGITTWMDLGRPDGSGPSKMDALLDGAGCRVIGTETFDAIDEQTSMVYSQVKVNVGPVANLFITTGIDNVDAFRVPVLVKVTMNPTAAGFNLEEYYDPTARVFSGTPAPNLDPGEVRGIVGIRLIEP
jgi:hypothetical protein